MKQWIRKTNLGSFPVSKRQEVWEYQEDKKLLTSFPLEITLGKPIDILKLKRASLEEIREYAKFLQSTANKLYTSNQDCFSVQNCPCCQASTHDAVQEFCVFGIFYYRCQTCGHVFVRDRPPTATLNEVFAESEEYSTPYIDRASLEIRLEQVIQPKVDWLLETYENYWHRSATSVLDVGAGGGHFVEGSRRKGLQAKGYELSKTSRRFAWETFGIELCGDDFLEEKTTTTESDLTNIITFWGLLEYTPEPRKFLNTARERLSVDGGLLVVEVPRYECWGSAIQKERPSTIARHLDPTSHVNCFSDASLATALFECGFQPIAAWYFGMDAYELLVQMSLDRDDANLLDTWADSIPALQSCLDRNLLCDDIIVAAIPIS
ncbi:MULTISPECIES: methyltransferase domain-containing protein [Spirulina sp. CCY15215]|uniref:class I SAM-dependent methyltransferase n=1 Tax=Spirulina sp. CCY15215 TaxID=2767591 RepID=UPI00194EB8B3